MRIICPTCASHYEVDRDKIGADGQLVRCAHCREVWLVTPADAPTASTDTALTPKDGRPERDINAFAAAVRAQANQGANPAAGRPAEGLIDFEEAKTRLRRRDPAGIGRSRTGTASLIGFGLVCASTLGLLVGLRTAIVSRVPAIAPAFAAVGLPVNPQGLALRDVKSIMVAEGGKTVLRLEGQIENLRDETTAVPNLTVVVRDDAQVPLYTWTTPAPKTTLAKGETIAFRSRLAAPPTDGRDVRVTFADAGSAVLSVQR